MHKNTPMILLEMLPKNNCYGKLNLSGQGDTTSLPAVRINLRDLFDPFGLYYEFDISFALIIYTAKALV